jgi:hypothetical protein
MGAEHIAEGIRLEALTVDPDYVTEPAKFLDRGLDREEGGRPRGTRTGRGTDIAETILVPAPEFSRGGGQAPLGRPCGSRPNGCTHTRRTGHRHGA